MTHIMGVTISGVSYLWADTAVTSPLPDDLTPRKTAFDEVSSVSSEYRVDEGAIKIERCGNALVACAGDARMARAIVATLREALDAGRPTEAAFQAAIASNGPIPAERKVQLCCAYPVACGSQMIAYNRSWRDEITLLGDEEIVQLGSAPNHVLAYAAGAIRSLPRDAAQGQPSAFLALILGALQRNGPAENLMSHGVGGPYCGAYVDGQGVHWQRDILFFLYSSRDQGLSPRKIVITYVRDDGLVAAPALGTPVIFLKSGSNGQQWVKKYWPMSLDHAKSGHVDYISFLDLVDRRVTVFYMNQEQMTKTLRMNVCPHQDLLRMQIEIHPELMVPIKGRFPEPTPGTFDSVLTYVPNDFG